MIKFNLIIILLLLPLTMMEVEVLIKQESAYISNMNDFFSVNLLDIDRKENLKFKILPNSQKFGKSEKEYHYLNLLNIILNECVIYDIKNNGNDITIINYNYPRYIYIFLFIYIFQVLFYLFIYFLICFNINSFIKKILIFINNINKMNIEESTIKIHGELTKQWFNSSRLDELKNNLDIFIIRLIEDSESKNKKINELKCIKRYFIKIHEQLMKSAKNNTNVLKAVSEII